MNIDDGIPVPDGKPGRKPVRYPWAEMKVGQSVFFADAHEGRNALASAYMFAKNRKVEDFRCKDGFLLDPDPGCTLIEWGRKCQREQEIHGTAHPYVVGRYQFVGRQENGGWRIWRAKNIPITLEETIPVPGMPGMRWVKE